MKTFRGGVHIPDNKSLSENIAIEQMPIVADYYVSLHNTSASLPNL